MLQLTVAAYFNLRFPAFILAHVESTYYSTALRWAGGLFPYNDPAAMPIASIVYTPLYAAFCAGLIHFLGPSLVLPKILALTASVLLILGLALSMMRLRFSAVSMSAGLLTFLALSSPWYLLWARADSLCALLSFAALAALSAAREPARYFAAALLVIIAALSKQTGLFLYPVGLALLWSRKATLPSWLAFAAAVPMLWVASGWWLDRASGGYYSYWTSHLLGTIPLKTLPALVKEQVPVLIWMGAVPGAAFALVWFNAPGAKSEFRRLLREPFVGACAYAAAIGTPILIVLSSRVGGGDNSYLPLLPAYGILAAACIEAWFRVSGRDMSAARLAGAVFAAVFLVTFMVLPPLHMHLSLIRRAIDGRIADMAAELEECASSGPCVGGSIVRGARVEGAAYAESANLTANIAHLGGKPWDEETSLMDYTGAGNEVPPRIRRSLIEGSHSPLIVEKGFEPFAIWNHMYWGQIPLEPSKRFLYPQSVREAFRACYRLQKINLNYFDLYVHGDCRWPK